MEAKCAAIMTQATAEWREGTRDKDPFSVDHEGVEEFTEVMFDGRRWRNVGRGWLVRKRQ